MKLFQSVKCQLATMGVGLHQLTQKYHLNPSILLIFFSYTCKILSECLFMYYKANTFQEYTESFYVTSTDILVAVCYAIIVFRVDGLFHLIDSCGHIVNTRLQCPGSKAIYDGTGQQIEKWSEIVRLTLGKGTPFALMLPKSLLSFFSYFATDSGSESFLLPMPMWFPFDSNNLIKYCSALALEFIMEAHIFLYVGCITSCGIGVFLFVIFGCSDVKNNLKLINKMAKSKRHRLDSMKHVYTFIRLHSDMKQLMKDFSNVFQPLFMILFPWSLVNVCGTMLMLQIELTRGGIKFEVLMLTMAYVFYVFGMIFLVCELCQRASDEFEEICDLIDQFQWYLFPDKLTHLLPTILIVAQEPVEIDCFGSTKCTRDSFKRIVNGGFSYFMVLRQFE